MGTVQNWYPAWEIGAVCSMSGNAGRQGVHAVLRKSRGFPSFHTTWWGSAWRAPLDSGGSSSDTQGYLTMCCSRIRLLKIAKVLICLIVVTQLCLFFVNSGSLFDLANTKIFRWGTGSFAACAVWCGCLCLISLSVSLSFLHWNFWSELGDHFTSAEHGVWKIHSQKPASFGSLFSRASFCSCLKQLLLH